MRIVVNGKEREIDTNLESVEFSYEGIVSLSNKDPKRIFTVTYSTPNSNGSLTPGMRIQFRSNERPLFNVVDTSDA